MKTKNKKQEQKIKPSIILLAVFGIALVFLLNHWRGIREIPEREQIFEMQEIQELKKIELPETKELEILRELKELKEKGIPARTEDLERLKDILPEEIRKMFEKTEVLPIQEIVFQEFISPDGNIKAKYPEHWLRIEEDMIKKLIPIPRHIKEEYNFTNLLLVQSIEIQNPLTLIVNRITTETPLNFDNILRIIEEINAPRGVGVDILSSKIQENKIIFEAIYQREDKQLRSKEKILFLEQGQKVFLITFLAPKEIWEDAQELRNKIIDSAQIIQ